MRKLILVAAFTLLNFLINAQQLRNPDVITGKLTAVTPRLDSWTPDFNDPRLKIKTRDEKGLIFARDLQPLVWTDYGSKHKGPDPVWQKGYGAGSLNSNLSSSSAFTPDNFIESDGGIVSNNFDGLTFSNVAPADPTMAVGPNHIIQMVNGQNGSSFFRIYNKAGGSLSLQAFMDQLPGASYNGSGDCIPWYDQLADRYVMTEFGDSSATGTNVNTLIFAVSQTNDPLGAWYIYEFYDASFFPDYPKYGMWHDAWYGMTRDFSGSYLGNSVYAFDRTKMLAGNPTATVQRFRFTSADNKFNSMCPVSLTGNTAAPAGTAGMFLYYNDDNFTASSADVDSVGIISFKVDFTTPANSVAQVEQSLVVAPFKSEVCGANNRNCAPSASGSNYDVISSRFMNRPYYRNFGTHQTIVGNHTVDATGNSVSGLRWYEFRKLSSLWAVQQQGTFAPQSVLPCSSSSFMHRFMGAVTINSLGQLALAYNSSSPSRFGSVGFTGRNETDPLNLMSYEEVDAFLGTGYGTFSNRWGDYNEIVPDVSNDSVFWFTAMYGAAGGWRTRIVSFKLQPNRTLDARIIALESPNNCTPLCDPAVQPLVTFRNAGSTTLTSAKINISINNGPVQTTNWTGSLNISEQTSFALPTITFPQGNVNIRVFISEPNGGTDEVPSNDSLTTVVNVSGGASTPITEGFENAVFPPASWSLNTNSTVASFRWQRVTSARRSGSASIKFDNYNLNQPGRFADIRTPVLDISGADSSGLSFWVAAAVYDNTSVDTLEVLVSTDCGATFQSVYKKWGTTLATRTGFVTSSFTPTDTEWRQEFVNLSQFTAAGKLLLAFRNINNFGNNIYIDDINVNKANFPRDDVAIISIDDPFDFVCSTPVKPIITFKNVGKDTLKSARFIYNIDGGTNRIFNWTGALPRLQSASVVLADANPATGRHLIKVFSTAPNGSIDANPANDTATRSFNIKEIKTAPITEDFEGPSFPPAQWDRLNPDTNISWNLTMSASTSGLASMYVPNYNYSRIGAVDEMISPLVTYQAVDSVFIDFQLAAATYSYPGSTQVPLDTLEVLVSTDCGKTYTSVYKKWGKELQTRNNPNDPVASPFFPKNNEWRKEHIDVTGLLGTGNTFLVSFRNTNNFGNNIFVDDINIYTKTLPAKLKNSGYLISPNPFQNSFVLQHYPSANNLKAIEIYSSTGQLVYRKGFATGTADAYQQIDLSRFASGVYNIRLVYTDKLVTERVIKLN